MGLFTRSKREELSWKPLNQENAIAEIVEASKEQAQLIFKHSTRCSISSMALNRFESEWPNDANCTIYFLDLIAFRAVSNKVADELKVEHQSPQAILIQNGEVTYHASHSAIRASEILEKL
ncbi:bacillithiol system redox-active protein YtxJ [Lishizhenia sp.]|uniref:bacillithiol system redox-active protein YtxJ n=1 Tax=Lishizhenia sp. TaxID=2497594 RepID=UPI00299F4463|nr:bacillithiol system redox-active protein YtxJ [Lishizhenia sp.]MDX1444802.1 bacillithiol system redox-active protein YtxJ [Lishizhenia sp.]